MAVLGATLLAPAPSDGGGLWGVRLGAPLAKVRQAFTPDGSGTAKWSEVKRGGVHTLRYRCAARDRCFTVPKDADFYFLGGRLVSATLRIDAQATPPRTSLLQLVLKAQAKARLGPAVATAVGVGRRTRYFARDGVTVVWSQDGPDADVKLHLDKRSPVGLAEAVASGAPDAGIDALPGARAYARAHASIAAKEWDAAASHLEGILAEKKASPLLRTQAKLVLAMVLAARTKAGSGLAGEAWKARARRDLRRARKLSPGLGPDLDALEKHLGLD